MNEPIGTATVDAVFDVTLAGVLATQTVKVTAVTADGTATGGTACTFNVPGEPDYGTKVDTLTFWPGRPRVQQIHVRVCKDDRKDPNETFTVSLVNESNATVVTRTGTATIR